MRLFIFTIRDRATDQFGTPMFLFSRGHALRSFGDQVNRVEEGNMINSHPEDYDLYEVGEYETSTAEFVVKRPELIGIGKDLKVDARFSKQG